MDPAYRPSLMRKDSGGSGALPFAGSDLVLSPSQWSSHVVGMNVLDYLKIYCFLMVGLTSSFFPPNFKLFVVFILFELPPDICETGMGFDRSYIFLFWWLGGSGALPFSRSY